ncbi:MAG: ABC-F family ATP-binding cassette domain-containing protein [Lachnospiraceae bacterium]|nr:ABC-F family ATP-binding cassette domain-containing protein [Lachnospiraceae bacterium]
MILNIQKVSKTFPGNEVLRGVSFHIEENEKAALVGINGAGKSTLLKIIVGEMAADDGSVVLSRDRTLGYLAQHQDLSGDATIYEKLMQVRQDVLDLSRRMGESERKMAHLQGEELENEMASYAKMQEAYDRMNGYAYKSEVVGVLKGLGFAEEDFGRKVATLSGGQKTRVALGALLLTSPDIILLDEPTNHLDMNSIVWLETYLMNYKGSVLIVSHDRYFLNRVVTKVIELDHGSARTYDGNYDIYSRRKEEIRHAEYLAYMKAEQERKHQEQVIAKLKQFNREKSIKRAESRQKMLDKMEMPDKPHGEDAVMELSFEPAVESGNDVLTVTDLSKGFDGLTLFSDVTFEIKKGEHVALIGNNGTGKSTLLKILNGVYLPDMGEFVLGSNVITGYYDQEMHVLHPDKTIFDEISDDYPSLNNTRIRNALAAFLFKGEDVFKYIRDLSGGERARVSLCKLMLSNANFIMLDEPTNHLDIESREILESAINSYKGTLFYVSHDRYFINRTAGRILDLTHKSLLNYIGNYDYYLEKKEDVEKANLSEECLETSSAGDTEAKQDWLAQKEEAARQRKLENDIKRCEKEIEELEAEDMEIDRLFEDPDVSCNPSECVRLGGRKEEIASRLEELYARWETLQENE